MCGCAWMCQILFIKCSHGRLRPKTALHYKSKWKGKLSLRKTSKQKYYIQTLCSSIMWRKHSTHTCQEHLSVQMFSFPHKFAPNRKFLFKIKNKHKPRKAKKFKFRADTATSLTPAQILHKYSKVLLAQLFWRARVCSEQTPGTGSGCVPLTFKWGLVLCVTLAPLTAIQGEAVSPTQAPAFPPLGLSHGYPKLAELAHCGIAFTRH